MPCSQPIRARFRARCLLPVGLLLATSTHARFIEDFVVVSRSAADGIESVQVAQTPAGSAVVAWISGGDIERRIIRPDGSMGSVAEVPQLTGAAASGLVLAGDLDGRVHLVWQEDGAIMSHRLNAAGAFGTTIRVSADGTSNAAHPAVAVDAAGRAAIAWERGDRIEAVRLDADSGQLAAPVQEMSPAHQSSPPGIAVDVSGDATVVWRRQGHVEFRRLNPEGLVDSSVFAGSIDPCGLDLPRIAGHPLALERPVIIARGLSTIGCSSGQVMWGFRTGFDNPTGLAISENVDLPADPEHRAVMDADGNVRFLWLNFDDPPPFTEPRMLLCMRRLEADVFDVRCTSRENGEIAEPAIAGAPDGSVLASFVRGASVQAVSIAPKQTLATADFDQLGTGAVSAPLPAVSPSALPTVVWRAEEDGEVRVKASQDVAAPACASDVAIEIGDDPQAPPLLVTELCTGRIDGPVAPVELTEFPLHGTVEVFLGAIIYTHAGDGSADRFRFTTHGPGGASNEVTVRVTVVGDTIFTDGFEPDTP
jgi:hypothetical protein